MKTWVTFCRHCGVVFMVCYMAFYNMLLGKEFPVFCANSVGRSVDLQWPCAVGLFIGVNIVIGVCQTVSMSVTQGWAIELFFGAIWWLCANKQCFIMVPMCFVWQVF